MSREGFQLLLPNDQTPNEWLVGRRGNCATDYPPQTMGIAVKPSKDKTPHTRFQWKRFLILVDGGLTPQVFWEQPTKEKRRQGMPLMHGREFYLTGSDLFIQTNRHDLHLQRGLRHDHLPSQTPSGKRRQRQYRDRYRQAIQFLRSNPHEGPRLHDPFFTMGGIRQVTVESALIAFLWEIPGAEHLFAIRNGQAIRNRNGATPERVIELMSHFCNPRGGMAISSLKRQARAAEEIIVASIVGTAR